MKKVVFVGNAPLKSDLSGFIDSCDCVVRYNNCRNYRINSGAKSDILVLNNTGDPRTQKTIDFFLKKRTKRKVDRGLPYTKGVSGVFFVRPAAEFCKLFLEEHIPDDNPLKDQELRDIQLKRNLAREIVKALFLEDREITFNDAGFYVDVWEKLLRYGKTDAIMPSTGILGIEMLLNCASFNHYSKYIAGFGLEGWNGHPWDLERSLLNDYIGKRVIVPLDNSGRSVRISHHPHFNPKTEANCPANRSIQELFMVSDLQFDTLEAVRKKYPASRTIYWDSREPDELALRRAAELARHVIAEDEIAQTVSDVLDQQVTLLSRYDADIARRFGEIAVSAVPGDSPPYPVNGGPILFCPINDTHVKTFAPICQLVGDCRFLLYGDDPQERAEEMLKSLGIEYQRGGVDAIAKIKPSVVVLGKDWSPAARHLIGVAHILRIPSVCLQEGPTEFNRDRRMQRCDYPLVQGPIMLRHLDQRVYFLTGNARFDGPQSSPLPEKPVAMINCNFWGETTQRERWLNVVIQACRDVGIEFFISRHPRDTGALSGLPTRASGPNEIGGHLRESTVVITRHSSVIYEALLLGRNVICHGPSHGEILTFDEDGSGAFPTTYRQAELVNAIEQAVKPQTSEQRSRVETFLDWHCGARDSSTTLRCASAIAAISWKASPLPRSFPRWLQPKFRLSHAFDALHRVYRANAGGK